MDTLHEFDAALDGGTRNTNRLWPYIKRFSQAQPAADAAG